MVCKSLINEPWSPPWIERLGGERKKEAQRQTKRDWTKQRKKRRKRKKYIKNKGEREKKKVAMNWIVHSSSLNPLSYSSNFFLRCIRRCLCSFFSFNLLTWKLKDRSTYIFCTRFAYVYLLLFYSPRSGQFFEPRIVVTSFNHYQLTTRLTWYQERLKERKGIDVDDWSIVNAVT